MFPLHKGDMDWWKCRSRSPLYFPSRMGKNHGREVEEWQALQRKSMEEREWEELISKEEEDPL